VLLPRLDDDTDDEDQADEVDLAGGSEVAITPLWNGEPGVKELLWNGLLIKKFNQPAKNQERLLTEFQEADWPWHIDDPLDNGPDPKRLRDTVDSLNEYHENPGMLRFRMDGTGQGVIWELVVQASPPAP
jgi:hypothetical protein